MYGIKVKHLTKCCLKCKRKIGGKYNQQRHFNKCYNDCDY